MKFHDSDWLVYQKVPPSAIHTLAPHVRALMQWHLQQPAGAVSRPLNKHLKRITIDENVHAKDESGKTALIQATIEGQPNAIAALLEAGASVHDTDALGKTAMTHAVTSGKLNMLPVLHTSDEITNAPHNLGTIPLLHAANAADFEAIEILAQHMPLSELNHVLLLLTREGTAQSIRAITRATDADINIQSTSGKTPLMHALLNDNDDAAIALVHEGADLHIKDAYGNSAMTYAYAANYKDFMDLLHQRGVQPLSIVEKLQIFLQNFMK